MSIVLKIVGGLLSGCIVGVLTFAFWPHIEAAVAPARPAVERPVFVTGSATARPATDKAAVEKLAFALRTAAQAPNAASPTRSIALTPVSGAAAGANGEALRLRAEGLVALAGGDFAAARALLERAAEAGDARALLVLGDSYDPATLGRMGALGLKGDAGRARDYYARALIAGVDAARQRIAALEAGQE